MTQFVDLLATHWFALVLLAAAAALGVVAGVRRRNLVPLLAPAVGCTAFALGAMFLHGWKYKLEGGGDNWSLAGTLLLVSLVVLYSLVVLVLAFRVWNPYVTGAVGFVAVAAAGGVAGRPIGTLVVEATKSVVWTRFASPWWLLLLLLTPLVYLVGRKSLSGLGPVRRWVAIAARTLVVVCLVLALAEPKVKRPAESMTVIFVVDRSASVPREREETATGDPIDRRFVRIRDVIESSVSARYGVNRSDQFGVMYFGRRPKLAYPPSPVLGLKNRVDEQGVILDDSYTDIAAALKLALASFPEGSNKRVVLVTDGNHNMPASLPDQVALAKKNKTAIDCIALAPNVTIESEVLVEEVVAPPVAATGARLPIRVYVRNANPREAVRGTLSLIRVGGQGDDQPIDKESDIDIDDGPQVIDASKKPAVVKLEPGVNVFKFRDREQARADASYTYRATFVPTDRVSGDRIANNSADAAVVARGSRKVLFLDQAETEGSTAHKFLLEQLRKAKIQYQFLHSKKLPTRKTDLGVYLSNFDCLVLANVPADDFTTDQMEVIRSQVYDQGCGLVMVGGADSFGPGGYQKTPVEEALPVECEIKAKKALGKGGLILVMHASEMADGNKWQKEIAKLAIDRLNSADMLGVVDYGFLGGQVNWQIPFEVIGDRKGELKDKVDKMNPGDMPDFDPFIQAAADKLADPQHNLVVKHCIVISDGDPNFSNWPALKKMADNNITCTTIGVATHGVNEDAKMQKMAESTKDGNGKPGNFYKVTDPKKLPAIYIKETRKISQSFIYDRTFDPDLRYRGGPTDGLPDTLPPLHGFVRTTNKQSPTHTMWIKGPDDKQAPEQEFPVLATWRYGLGKAVAFTSDARDDAKGWARDWASKGMYQKFWENTVNWSMREVESGELAVSTRYIDGKVKVTVTAENQAKDKNGRPLPLGGLTLRGGVTPPGKPQPGDKVPTVTFKPNKSGYYEAEFDAIEAGGYFLNVQAEADELDADGNPVIDPATGRPKRRQFGARAAASVPYSAEFSVLSSNTSLLAEIARSTEGQYFDEPNDPQALAKAADFYRPPPSGMEAEWPSLPFEYWMMFAAGLLLFVDVGVRRISLEFKEVRGGTRRLWAKLRRGEDLPEDEDGVLGKLGQRKKATAQAMAKRAARKFEAGDTPSDTAPAGADEYAADVGKKGGALPPPPPPRSAQKAEDEDDDFMSRMRKAKQRGQKKQDES